MTSVVPDAWATDVEVLRLSGAAIEDRADHVVVRSPANPGYHWGNFLLVTDPASRSAARHWIGAFDEAFPDAGYVAIALPGEPDPLPWTAAGFPAERELVLTRAHPIGAAPAPAGYRVRPLASPSDWDALVAADVVENAEHGREDDAPFREFATRQAQVRAELCGRGVAQFLGAFAADGALAAWLGIVLCGPLRGHRQVARYQHVGTAPAHRRRGLAGHLLGVAGGWAADHGADQWEIHVDPGTDAHRLYLGLGWRPHAAAWQVHARNQPSAGE